MGTPVVGERSEQCLRKKQKMGDDHLTPRPAVELYDLEKDPLEMDNLAGMPEIKEIENDLASRLDKFLEETNDPILGGSIPRPPEEADIIRRIQSSVKRAK